MAHPVTPEINKQDRLDAFYRQVVRRAVATEEDHVSEVLGLDVRFEPTAPEVNQAAVPEPRHPCDHICRLDDDHVERDEQHQYGYEIPSPRDRPLLSTIETLALTVALGQIRGTVEVSRNTTAVLVFALERICRGNNA